MTTSVLEQGTQSQELLAQQAQFAQLEAEFGSQVLDNLQYRFNGSTSLPQSVESLVTKDSQEANRFAGLKNKFWKLLGGVGVSAGTLVAGASDVEAHIPDGTYDCTNSMSRGRTIDHIDSVVDEYNWETLTYVCKIDAPPPAVTDPPPVDTLPPTIVTVTQAPVTPKTTVAQKPPETLPLTTLAPVIETTTTQEILATTTTESVATTTTTIKIEKSSATSDASTSTSNERPTTTAEVAVVAPPDQSDRSGGLPLALLLGGGTVVVTALAFGVGFWRHHNGEQEKQPPVQPINLA